MIVSFYTPAVPSPLPSITVSHSSPFYAATSFSMTCEYNLDELMDAIQTTTVSWAVGGSGVDTSQSRITVRNNSLDFNPLTTSDSGNYMCTLTLVPQEYISVQEAQPSSPVTIIVEGRYYIFYA